MAINPIEVVSLLEKINLATINNPKVLQNAAKAIELISNSSNPSIRQKALIFQEKLKENPTFIELNKKEEIKQAEIQQKERSERLQEQLQAKRAVSASNKIEKEKKEEKNKDQEFKALLNSGSFSSLSIWQQLEVLDYISTNFETMTIEQKSQSLDCINQGLINSNPEVQKQSVEATNKILEPAKYYGATNSPATLDEKIQYYEQKAKEQQQGNVVHKTHQAAINAAATGINAIEQDRENLKFATLNKFNVELIKKGVIMDVDETGKCHFYSTKTKQEILGYGYELSLVSQQFNQITNNNEALRNVDAINEIEAISKQQSQQLSQTFQPKTRGDLINKSNELFQDMLQQSEQLKKQGLFVENISDQAVHLQAKNYLFSDLLKSNYDLTMNFHIALKDFIRGNYEEVGQKDAKSYSIFTLPFVQTLLKQGESGERMLQEIIANQWFSQEQAKHYVQELKKTMQQPDFAEKVAQAEQLDQQKSIETFRQEYSKEKCQDGLMNYFYNHFRAEYENLWKKKCFDKSDPNYEMYKVFADGHIRDHLMKMNIKELKAFIEQETNQPVNIEELRKSIKATGVDEKDIDKMLAENGLSEESKQENTTLIDVKKTSNNDIFLTGYETKEQIEQTISDNSKRLGYETANPSKPNNQEEQINKIQYQQPSSTSSNV